MPTLLPIREPQARVLSWPETVRFFVLLARVRWLDWRLHAAGRRTRATAATRPVIGSWPSPGAGWRSTPHQHLLDIPEPPHVQIARGMLQPPLAARGCGKSRREPLQ